MGRRFVAERQRDRYYRAAKEEGLRSRAAFKLAHLDDRFHLLAEGDAVLDLGAAPGGWSLVARERIGRSGRVVAVDPRGIEPIEGVERIRTSAEDPRLAERLGSDLFDLVLSDMSPRISGAYSTDHARSVDLVRVALRVAIERLRPGGTLVAKVFQGDLLPELERDLRTAFREVVRAKPPASRAQSSELYLIGFGFRRGPHP